MELGPRSLRRFRENNHGRREFSPQTVDQQGANCGDVRERIWVEELPYGGCGAGVGFPVEQLRAPNARPYFAEPSPPEKNIFGLLGVDEGVHVDELVENRN